MKKSKVFIGLGTLALAFAAIFATKANRKFTGVASAYFNKGGTGGTCFVQGLSSATFTTANNQGFPKATLKIYTASATDNVVFTTLYNVGTGSTHNVVYIEQ